MASAEIGAYASELSWVLDQMCRSLDGLSPEQLTASPIVTGNSPRAIAKHVIEATTVYALGLGCGLPVSRDRKSEFVSSAASVAEVTAALRELAARLEANLSSLAPERLDERMLPAPELWGTGPPHEISRREALIESVRHAALHLGELRLTRDLVMSGDSAVR